MSSGVAESILENADHIAAFLAACAVIYTAIVSQSAIRKWRDEKRFDRRLENAIKILKIVYKIRINLDVIRSHGIPQILLKGSINDLKKRGVSPEEIKQHGCLIRAQIVINKIANYYDDVHELTDIMPEAHAFFGDNVKNALERLSKLHFRIEVMAEDIIKIDFDKKENQDEGERMINSLLFNRESDKPDDIELEVRQQVRIVEEVCRPIIDPDIREHNSTRSLVGCFVVRLRQFVGMNRKER